MPFYLYSFSFKLCKIYQIDITSIVHVHVLFSVRIRPGDRAEPVYRCVGDSLSKFYRHATRFLQVMCMECDKINSRKNNVLAQSDAVRCSGLI